MWQCHLRSQLLLPTADTWDLSSQLLVKGLDWEHKCSTMVLSRRYRAGSLPWQIYWVRGFPSAKVAHASEVSCRAGWVVKWKNRRVSCHISPPSSPFWGHWLSSVLGCGSNLKFVSYKRVWGGFLKSVWLKQDGTQGWTDMNIHLSGLCLSEGILGWWYGLDLELYLEWKDLSLLSERRKKVCACRAWQGEALR